MGMLGDVACALDPVLLAEKTGITPDPWQSRALRSTSDRCLYNACRQSGKSTIAALVALHTVLFTPNSLVLLVSRGLRQSGELFKKCVGFYRDLGRPVASRSETALTLTLVNGSRIVSLPGTDDGTIRGYSGVNLLIVDEASRVEDDTYHACRPMLAVSGGRLIGLSTPWGKRGWWFEAWTGNDPWERYLVPASDCPRISPQFLAEEQRTLGRWFYQQEYECQFSESVGQVFSHEDIQAAISDDLDPLWPIEIEPGGPAQDVGISDIVGGRTGVIFG